MQFNEPLVRGESVSLTVDVIDRDEIENHLYRAHTGEFLDTALGCMKTARVERIRASPSYVRADLDPEFLASDALDAKPRRSPRLADLGLLGYPHGATGEMRQHMPARRLTKIGLALFAGALLWCCPSPSDS